MPQYIFWLCTECSQYNYTENHEGDAHFPSMICEECDNEIEGCLCDQVITTELLTKFFNQPGINKSGICLEADISQQYLNRVLNGTQPITYGLLSKLIPVLAMYGF